MNRYYYLLLYIHVHYAYNILFTYFTRMQCLIQYRIYIIYYYIKTTMIIIYEIIRIPKKSVYKMLEIFKSVPI